MPDREKVIKGLETCGISGTREDCEGYGCPYFVYNDEVSDECIVHLFEDAIALLKAQEPREMSDAELMDAIRKTPIMVKPPVDAEPVVYARWIDECCSVCGTYVYHGDADNYCPHCGAKMDKED